MAKWSSNNSQHCSCGCVEKCKKRSEVNRGVLLSKIRSVLKQRLPSQNRIGADTWQNIRILLLKNVIATLIHSSGILGLASWKRLIFYCPWILLECEVLQGKSRYGVRPSSLVISAVSCLNLTFSHHFRCLWISCWISHYLSREVCVLCHHCIDCCRLIYLRLRKIAWDADM